MSDQTDTPDEQTAETPAPEPVVEPGIVEGDVVQGDKVVESPDDEPSEAPAEDQ